jgi:membrane protein implicated in regulation of membrane protease activity
MNRFTRNLILWFIIALAAVVALNFYRSSAVQLPSWVLSWWPFVLFLLAYVLIGVGVQQRRMRRLTARTDALAERSHQDAERIIALLRQIRDQTSVPAPPTERSEA